MGVLFVAATVSACTHDMQTPSVAALQAAEGPEQESWNPDLKISEDGLPRIDLDAPYMARFEHPDSTWLVFSGGGDSLERVVVHLFDANGDSSATVHANMITYYEREKRFLARGEVIVVTKEGKTLESEHLVWTEADRTVRTPGYARIVSPNRTVTGYGLVADEDLADFSMSRVSGVIIPEAGE